MAVKLGSARIDENGNAHGGKAGDQNGKEVSTQDWYAHSKGWIVLRAIEPNERDDIAVCMRDACNNPHIGYDQYQRDTLYNEAKQYNFDVSKVTKDVECDCSSLVRVCLAYAGIHVPSFRTSDQVSKLMATGAFEKFEDDAHCKKSANLLRGDILVTRTQGHTVVVLSNGSNADQERGTPVPVASLGDRTLSKGCKGADVKELQECLILLGFSLPKYGADGDYGSETVNAVKDFQRFVGLPETGVFDAETYAAFDATLRPPVPAPAETPETPQDRPCTMERCMLVITGTREEMEAAQTQYGGTLSVIIPSEGGTEG